MTPHAFPESDWKTFRELQALAIERFCQRVLEKIEPIIRDRSLSPHQRYLKVFRFLRVVAAYSGRTPRTPRSFALTNTGGLETGLSTLR